MSLQSYLVAQCGTVQGSLTGFADDFGRSYSSIFDAMKRCKEGILIYLKYIRNGHIERLDFYLISNRCVIFIVKDCKGISRTVIKGKTEKLKFGEDHEIEYHLPTVPIWTLRSSESVIECKTCTDDPKTYEYSMFRRCFDAEGIQ